MPPFKPTDFDSSNKIQWCPGCGDFPILFSIKNALAQLGIPGHETCIVSGIGCAGKLPHYVKTYGFESIHGRVLPTAAAIKLVNQKINVIGVGGDGDGYGIGMGHFIHIMRRNFDLVYIVHNNQVYGLTKGQTSPTSEKGYKSPSTPRGVIEVPVNPMALAIVSGATFVARGYSGDLNQLSELIKRAIQHRGFSLVDVFQPCISWNKVNTYQSFQKSTYKIDETKHDIHNKEAAMKLAMSSDKLPLGVLYQEMRPTYDDEVIALKKGPVVSQDISDVDIKAVLQTYL